MKKPMIIAIDGPVGVGKSTVAREIARRLGYFHLDTGSMYRSVTLMAMRQGIALHDEAALTTLAADIAIDLIDGEQGLVVLCNGQDVSREIRSPEVSTNTSPVSDVRGVREHMVSRQRAIARKHGSVVAEGRDMSSVVFPDAPWKIYLDANVRERAERRFMQMKRTSSSPPPDFDSILHSLIIRDERDRRRPYGPLCVAADALIVDTSMIPQERVITIIIGIIKPACLR